MTRAVDPKAYWEQKILQWESGRYRRDAGGSVLERLTDRASASLRFRIGACREILKPHVAEKIVAEIGAGRIFCMRSRNTGFHFHDSFTVLKSTLPLPKDGTIGC